jgi:hypothetical protein
MDEVKEVAPVFASLMFELMMLLDTARATAVSVL